MFGQLEEYYKLPDDMAARLQTEPELVLPQMAAKVHVAVVRGIQQYLATQLPSYIEHTTRMTAAEAKAKTAFYEANPDLTGYEEQVLQAGRTFRQMNPNAAPEVAIKAIGNLVRAAMGLQSPAPGGGMPSTPGASSAPAAPAFRPAGGGHSAAPVAQPPSSSGDDWAGLAQPD